MENFETTETFNDDEVSASTEPEDNLAENSEMLSPIELDEILEILSKELYDDIIREPYDIDKADEQNEIVANQRRETISREKSSVTKRKIFSAISHIIDGTIKEQEFEALASRLIYTPKLIPSHFSSSKPIDRPTVIFNEDPEPNTDESLVSFTYGSYCLNNNTLNISKQFEKYICKTSKSNQFANNYTFANFINTLGHEMGHFMQYTAPLATPLAIKEYFDISNVILPEGIYELNDYIAISGNDKFSSASFDIYEKHQHEVGARQAGIKYMKAFLRFVTKNRDQLSCSDRDFERFVRTFTNEIEKTTHMEILKNKYFASQDKKLAKVKTPKIFMVSDSIDNRGAFDADMQFFLDNELKLNEVFDRINNMLDFEATVEEGANANKDIRLTYEYTALSNSFYEALANEYEILSGLLSQQIAVLASHRNAFCDAIEDKTKRLTDIHNEYKQAVSKYLNDKKHISPKVVSALNLYVDSKIESSDSSRLLRISPIYISKYNSIGTIQAMESFFKDMDYYSSAMVDSEAASKHKLSADEIRAITTVYDDISKVFDISEQYYKNTADHQEYVTQIKAIDNVTYILDSLKKDDLQVVDEHKQKLQEVFEIFAENGLEVPKQDRLKLYEVDDRFIETPTPTLEDAFSSRVVLLKYLETKKREAQKNLECLLYSNDALTNDQVGNIESALLSMCESTPLTSNAQQSYSSYLFGEELFTLNMFDAFGIDLNKITQYEEDSKMIPITSPDEIPKDADIDPSALDFSDPNNPVYLKQIFSQSISLKNLGTVGRTEYLIEVLNACPEKIQEVYNHALETSNQTVFNLCVALAQRNGIKLKDEVFGFEKSEE